MGRRGMSIEQRKERVLELREKFWKLERIKRISGLPGHRKMWHKHCSQAIDIHMTKLDREGVSL